MSWIEVRARFHPVPEDWSPAVDAFAEAGIENTLEEGDTLSGAIVEVEGIEPILDALEARLRELGAAEVTRAPLEEVNWDEAWRQFFKPKRVAERFVIRPTWEPYEAEPNDLVITLDPGQAFGTGEHPTTRGVLGILEETPVEGARVLDLGTGSGVLAIAAGLLEAAEILGTDVETVAVAVARENAAVNGIEATFAEGAGFDPVPPGDWDIILSNIISAVLIRLAPEVAERLISGGFWIVSGIIVENWPDVKSAAEQAGFELELERHEDGWVSARFRR